MTTTSTEPNDPGDDDDDPESEDPTEFVNPDYVDGGPIGDIDMGRIITRLNETRRPGPDNGDTLPSQPPASHGNGPLVAMLNPDGVTVMAVGNGPSFNRQVPDYYPELAQLGVIGGVPTPVTTDGLTSWS